MLREPDKAGSFMESFVSSGFLDSEFPSFLGVTLLLLWKKLSEPGDSWYLPSFIIFIVYTPLNYTTNPRQLLTHHSLGNSLSFSKFR